MGRRLTSALALAAVLGVTAAAVLDSVRPEEPHATAPPPKPPACRDGQLGLFLDGGEDPPRVVLRHVRGPRCTTPAYDIVVRVVPRVGRPRDDLVFPTDGGLSAPGLQSERTFWYHPRCEEQGPFHVQVRVGPYSVNGSITSRPCLRTPEGIAAYRRRCVRSWNAPANRANRDLVVTGRFDIAMVFRSSDAVEVERCGVHFVSSATAESLVAYRAFARSWLLEPGSPEAAYDDRPAAILPDGALALADD